MIKIFITTFLTLFLSFSTFADDTVKKLGQIKGGALHEMPGWFTDSFLDIEEDVADAKDNNKDVLLFFHLAGCPYCDMVLNENFRGGKNTDFIQKHFSVIAINIKGDKEVSFNGMSGVTEKLLSQQLRVQYTPTIVFISKENEVVYRTNGYRSPKAIKNVLNYVTDQAYKKMSLSSYIEQTQKGKADTYRFLSHPNITTVTSFKGLTQPVAILFEDKDCTDCAAFHQTILNQKAVKKELDAFLLVRLDAYSDKTIIDFEGNKTTPRKWATKLKLNYRPGFVLFNDAKEITRIDGKLFSFHFKEVFRFVSKKMYEEYKIFGPYLAARQAELINQGIDIDISK
jgi:thioredoxin-related protein